MTSPSAKKPVDSHIHSPMQPSSSSTPNGQQNGVEQPQRSRNARAQARHRAKRKAYIEQASPPSLSPFYLSYRAQPNRVRCRIFASYTSRIRPLCTRQCLSLSTYTLRIRDDDDDNARARTARTRCVAFLASLSLIHIPHHRFPNSDRTHRQAQLSHLPAPP